MLPEERVNRANRHGLYIMYIMCSGCGKDAGCWDMSTHWFVHTLYTCAHTHFQHQLNHQVEPASRLSFKPSPCHGCCYTIHADCHTGRLAQKSTIGVHTLHHQFMRPRALGMPTCVVPGLANTFCSRGVAFLRGRGLVADVKILTMASADDQQVNKSKTHMSCSCCSIIS